MKAKIGIGLIILILFSSSKVWSQQDLVIDLAETPGSTTTLDVNPNTQIKIEIINKLPNPNEEYDILVVRKSELLPVLNIPSNTPPAAFAGHGTPPCDAFIKIVNAVYDTSTEESDLPGIIQEIEEEIAKIQSGLGDPTCTVNEIAVGVKSINDTKYKLTNSYKLRRGEQLEVTISRKLADGTTRIWKHIYKTPGRGQWVTTYGFSFINRSFNEEESFFSRAVDDGFVITQENNRSDLDFIPSVFFTWLPEKGLTKDLSINATAGLGFDLEAPVTFLGLSFLYNQNISLIVGLTAHQQQFLNGIYDENQKVSENLTQDQLHEDLYTINPFFSLTFRFGSNIFTSNSNTQQSQN